MNEFLSSPPSAASHGWTIAFWWLLVLSPALPFLALSLSYWRIVEQKIGEVKRRLAQYGPELYERAYGYASAGDIDAELREFHNWRTYVAPVVLTCVIASVFTAIALTFVGIDLGLPSELRLSMTRTLPTVIVAAGGAYLWGLDDLIKRHRSADMSSTALHGTWLRMLICAAIGGLLGRIFSSSSGIDMMVALAIGGLPIEDIKEWITTRADLRLQRAAVHPPDLELVQGLTRRVRDRLHDEDIDSVQSLAFADPVRLLFRTNIEWNVILDLVDQAMLINMVGDKIELLRPMSVRGAIEIASLYEQAVAPEAAEAEVKDVDDKEDGPDYPSDTENAVALLEKIGAALGHGMPSARNLGYQMYYDPLVEFVWTHWNAARPGRHDDDAPGDAPSAVPSYTPISPRKHPARS